MPTAQPSVLRKTPTQTRAKERFERILAAAADLIARDGSDNLKMSEVALTAEVPIGSLYQYFPDRASILLTLADRIMDRVRAGLSEAMAGVETPTDADRVLLETLEAYYQLFLQEPVARDIWFGVQANKTLHELDIEDSRANGEIVFRALKKFLPRKKWKRFQASCFLMMQLTGMAVRLAVSVDRQEGDRIISIYGELIRRELIESLEAA